MVELYQIRRVTGGQGLAAFHSYGHVADLELGITEEADGEVGMEEKSKKQIETNQRRL
jgi:hypothetical protein